MFMLFVFVCLEKQNTFGQDYKKFITKTIKQLAKCSDIEQTLLNSEKSCTLTDILLFCQSLAAVTRTKKTSVFQL
jgi:hypothetical protein